MKKLWLVLAAALAFAPTALTAREAPATEAAPAVAASLPDADPALWAVRDDDTTIYLFGTFHLLDGRPWFNDEVRMAFDESDELVLEAILPEDPSELQPLVLRYAVDPEGRKLSDRLTPEQNEALARALSSLGAPAAAFDPLEPWFVSMTLAAVIGQRLGISAEHGPERILTEAAKARNMPIAELEGLEWQIRLFDAMPEEQQLAQLRQTLDDLDRLEQVLAPMLAAWSAGDIEGLQQLIDGHKEQDPELHRLLFADRNATWATWIQERMDRPGTVFIAVGAGHLAGADSVQALLQARGLQVERVQRQAAEPEPAL